jgi:hypothetical protein
MAMDRRDGQDKRKLQRGKNLISPEQGYGQDQNHQK